MIDEDGETLLIQFPYTEKDTKAANANVNLAKRSESITHADVKVIEEDKSNIVKSKMTTCLVKIAIK